MDHLCYIPSPLTRDLQRSSEGSRSLMGSPRRLVCHSNALLACWPGQLRSEHIKQLSVQAQPPWTGLSQALSLISATHIQGQKGGCGGRCCQGTPWKEGTLCKVFSKTSTICLVTLCEQTIIIIILLTRFLWCDVFRFQIIPTRPEISECSLQGDRETDRWFRVLTALPKARVQSLATHIRWFPNYL